MSTTKDFHPELLRPLEQVCKPDPRNTSFVTPDHETGNYIPLELRDLHEAVSKHALHAKVPEDIMMQFETARNLYLHAWFVYRFYPVCEHHALACLELALRKRYEPEAPKKYRNKRDGKLYLKGALHYTIDRGHVKHEGFRRWREAAQQRALLRYQMKKTDEMYAKGLKTIDLDYSEVTVTDADRNWEYLKFLADFLPELRNNYAHGTSMLHNQVLTTLEVVSEIINQIYPAE
jgi:hypothetical protein